MGDARCVLATACENARMRFALRSLVVFGGAFAFLWGLSTVSAYREASTDVQALVTVLAAALVWGIALLFLWLWRRARSWREKQRSG